MYYIIINSTLIKLAYNILKHSYIQNWEDII